jgi:DnaA family protein
MLKPGQVLVQPQKAQERPLSTWGAPGVGCTHLLQAACNRANQLNLAAMYLPLEHLYHQSPTLLEGLENLDLICIDDMQCIAGLPQWEEALFHLYNRLRAAPNTCLLVAGTGPVNQLKINLADLSSRLQWGVVYQLHALSDEEIATALQIRAKARGLILTEEVAHYLIRRCPRTMSVLYQHLESLDKASMAAQRRLTIPFIKNILGI